MELVGILLLVPLLLRDLSLVSCTLYRLTKKGIKNLNDVYFLLFSFSLSLQSHPLFLPGFHLHVQGKKFGLKSICQPLVKVKDANSE